MTSFTDETLMRFADGELDAETSRQVEAAIDSDPAVAARVALFLDTGRLAKDAMQPLLDEPVPGDLRRAVEAMIERKSATQSKLERPQRRLLVPANDWWRTAAAAAVAAVIGLAGGHWIGNMPRGAGDNGSVLAGDYAHFLASVVSGAEASAGGNRFRAIATFRDSAGAICREFEIDRADKQTVAAVSCLEGGAWTTRFAVLAPAGDGGYAPASSGEALDAYLSAIDAGQPLAADAEAEALKSARAVE
jgi:hypothetical protein